MSQDRSSKPVPSGGLAGPSSIYPGSMAPNFFPDSSGNIDLEGGTPFEEDDPNTKPWPEAPTGPNPNPGDDHPEPDDHTTTSDEPMAPAVPPTSPEDGEEERV